MTFTKNHALLEFQKAIISQHNETLNDFFNLNYKLNSIEKFLIQKDDYFLNFILTDSIPTFNALYQLSKDYLDTIPVQNHGDILANYCINISNDCLSISSEFKKAKISQRQILK